MAVEIHSMFGQHHDIGFRNQICNAAVSISNNIAEEFDRNSKATFIHFLKISSESGSEVKSMLYLAKRLNYISEETKLEHIEKCSEVSRIIRGLINSLKN